MANVVILCSLLACSYEEKIAFIPTFQMDGEPYYISNSTRLQELPEDYEKLGTITKAISQTEFPVEDNTINVEEYIGCNVYRNQLYLERVFVETDGIYQSWIIEELKSNYICFDGTVYKLVTGISDGEQNIDPQTLPEQYIVREP